MNDNIESVLKNIESEFVAKINGESFEQPFKYIFDSVYADIKEQRAKRVFEGKLKQNYIDGKEISLYQEIVDEFIKACSEVSVPEQTTSTATA